MKRARHIFKSAAVLGVLVVAVTLSAGHAEAKAAQQQQDGRTAHIANPVKRHNRLDCFTPHGVRNDDTDGNTMTNTTNNNNQPAPRGA